MITPEEEGVLVRVSLAVERHQTTAVLIKESVSLRRQLAVSGSVQYHRGRERGVWEDCGVQAGMVLERQLGVL